MMKLVKKLLVVAILLAGTNFGVVKAQEQEKNKKAIGVQTAFTSKRAGIGIKYGYNFTDMLRFAFESNYYLSSKESYDVYDESYKKIGKVMDGRLWDFNSNLNFVFGDKNFHFYLIGGIGFAYGHKFSRLTNEFTNEIGSVYDDKGNYVGYGILEDDVLLHKRFGIALNSGCGIEWQITPAIRWHLENTFELALPSLSAWRVKTGLSYCF